MEIVNRRETVEIRLKQGKLNNDRLIELEAEHKLLATKSNNPSLENYNKIKRLLAEKEN